MLRGTKDALKKEPAALREKMKAMKEEQEEVGVRET